MLNEMTTEQILNSNLTKSDKMRALFTKGYTRKEVAQLIGCGYGFVQNVYARTYPERVIPHIKTSRPATLICSLAIQSGAMLPDYDEAFGAANTMKVAHLVAKGKVKPPHYLNPPKIDDQDPYAKRLAAALKFVKDMIAKQAANDAARAAAETAAETQG